MPGRLTPEGMDAILAKMETAVYKVDKHQSSMVKLQGAEVALLTAYEAARDFMMELLKAESCGGHREQLRLIFGGDCARIAQVRATVETVGFSPMYAGDQRIATCLRACDSVDNVLTDLGCHMALNKAKEQQKDALQRRRSTVIAGGDGLELLRQLAEKAEAAKQAAAAAAQPSTAAPAETASADEASCPPDAAEAPKEEAKEEEEADKEPLPEKPAEAPAAEEPPEKQEEAPAAEEPSEKQEEAPAAEEPPEKQEEAPAAEEPPEKQEEAPAERGPENEDEVPEEAEAPEAPEELASTEEPPEKVVAPSPAPEEAEAGGEPDCTDALRATVEAEPAEAQPAEEAAAMAPEAQGEGSAGVAPTRAATAKGAPRRKGPPRAPRTRPVIDEALVAKIVAAPTFADLDTLEPNREEKALSWMVWMVHRVHMDDPTLTRIDFTNMRMPTGREEPRIAPKLVRAMATNTRISACLLANSNLQGPEGVVLAASLKSNKRLKELNVDSNFLSGRDLEQLGDGVANCATLEQVRCNNQHTGPAPRAAVEAFINAAKANPSLIKIGMTTSDAGAGHELNQAIMHNNELARIRRKEAAEQARIAARAKARA